VSEHIPAHKPQMRHNCGLQGLEDWLECRDFVTGIFMPDFGVTAVGRLYRVSTQGIDRAGLLGIAWREWNWDSGWPAAAVTGHRDRGRGTPEVADPV